MLSYALKRMALMVLMLVMISIGAFLLIQLPPGDFVSTYVAQSGTTDELLDDELVEELRIQDVHPCIGAAGGETGLEEGLASL